MFNVSLNRPVEGAVATLVKNATLVATNSDSRCEFDVTVVDDSNGFVLVRLNGTRLSLCFSLYNNYDWKSPDSDTPFITYLGLEVGEYPRAWFNWITKNGGSLDNGVVARPSKRCDRSIYPTELKIRNLSLAAIAQLAEQELKKKQDLREVEEQYNQYFDRYVSQVDYYDSAW